MKFSNKLVYLVQVKASVITTESDEIQKGIVDLVNQHMIRKLVIEATPWYVRYFF